MQKLSKNCEYARPDAKKPGCKMAARLEKA
jgi:hypothetical protein